jgi:tRNA (guanine-N7-)-methyltransferase
MSEFQDFKDKNSKDISSDFSYQEDFNYKHNNPYHEKLAIFDDFVLRDESAEENAGKWNTEIFKKEGPLGCEIGTGYGHFMHEFCQKNPDTNFVGLDYRFKRSFNLAKSLAKLKTRNFKYLRAKGERLQFLFAENELDMIFYFFPDPWPKTRHHKKRLFQQPFIDACFKTLKPGGTLFVKTDHDLYFQWMNEVLENENRFDIILNTSDLHKEHPEHLLSKYITKFEKIFIKKKTPTKSLVLRKKA